MKINLVILVCIFSFSQAYTQITSRVFIEGTHWMDGVGSFDIIEFGHDSIYRQYQWNTNEQPPVLKNLGSYLVSNDIIYCQPISLDHRFELIITLSDGKTVLHRHEKVYSIDGTLSDMQIRGPAMCEFEKAQYEQWKKNIGKN